jgi:hypothetical protein
MHANTNIERGSPTDRFIENLRDDPAISYIALYQDSMQSSQRMQVFHLSFLRSEALLCLFPTAQCMTISWGGFPPSTLSRLFNARLAKSKSLVVVSRFQQKPQRKCGQHEHSVIYLQVPHCCVSNGIP